MYKALVCKGACEGVRICTAVSYTHLDVSKRQLPAAVSRRLGPESDVRAVIPLYPSVREKFGDQIVLEKEFYVPLSWRKQYCGIWSISKDNVKFYFIDNEYYFKRNFLYGAFDDGERFAFFCRAVLEMMGAVDFYPDILHANDWQSALSVLSLIHI